MEHYHALAATHDYVDTDYVLSEEDEDDEELGAPGEDVLVDDFGSDSEGDEMLDNVSDTSALQAKKGRDIQGIPWDRLHFTRERYRETRLEQYKNYENLQVPHEELEKECPPPDKSGEFFEFQYNTRAVKCTIVHFQLRNLVWATSKHDVYAMHHHAINHWSPLSRKTKEVLNLGGQVDRSVGGSQHGMGRVQISTICVHKNLAVAGGFHGELVCKNLDNHAVSYSARITHDENAITNAVEVTDALGSLRVMSSNNDCFVRVFDGETFSSVGRYLFPWAVNHTSVSPDGKLVVVVGDDPEGLLADSVTGKVVGTLKGHRDFSFASAWHPEGRVFATGNQDTTCRLWDVRYLGPSLATLKGRIGAVRSLRFSSDGRFLAMAEPADFVHIYDTKEDYRRSQEIDIFGEVAGISFSPDGEALYVGVADRTYGSLLEYNRKHFSQYTDMFV